ncbi:hypothetical protein TRFO_12780 [Tritrichomonas foetus]|uniref:Uncharacterized protein n=1 Tax=Tritrichomonas foetus TaxID=1144522 RepID=A0A1J4L083_9EUKA|nr:hypothetical protein TRFO_12780 [Tritrichomonas foetus]|eukprot:OHT16911.1 hypothetical protein TRFO_12780 [Tritrichomonas foetus]
MEKFEKLSFVSSCDVPPIEKLLQSIQEDANSSFYRLGTSLHFAQSLNPLYTLVSLRDIVNLSPLSPTIPYKESEWIPTNSYKWLFLIVSIASRQISNDSELEGGKIKFIYKTFGNFISRADPTKNWAISLISGVICATVRMIDETGIIPDDIFEYFSYDVLKTFLPSETQKNSNSKTPVKILPKNPPSNILLTDFSERDILLYSFPVASANISQNNVFGEQLKILYISVLRLLNHLMKIKLPEKVKEYCHEIQKLYVRVETAEYAKKVLIQLFNNNEEKAIEFSDTIQYTKAANLLHAFHFNTDKFTKPLSYNDTVLCVRELKKMSKIASNHPIYFKNFLNKTKSTVAALVAILASDYDSEFISVAPLLLKIGEIQLDDLSIPLDLFIQTENKNLRNELEKLLLIQDTKLFIQTILKSLHHAINFGFKSQPFFELLEKLIEKHEKMNENYQNSNEINGENDDYPNENVAKILVSNLLTIMKKCHYDCEHIPQIYSLISKYITVNAHYLETSVCMCNFQEKPKKNYNIDLVKQFQKFQYSGIISKLKTPMIISAVQLKYSQKRFTLQKLPRTVQVFVSDSEITDQNQLISNSVEWRKICDLRFARDSSFAKSTLRLPLFATSIQFKFASFYETEHVKLVCPQCGTDITESRAGLCPTCRDNVFKCNRCRNINYSNIDGFICNECGNSNYAQLEFAILAKPYYSHTHITNDNECTAALKACDELLASAQNSVDSLNRLRKQIEDTLSPLNAGDKAVLLNNLYNDKCHAQFQLLSEYVQHVYAIRGAVNSFKGKSNKSLNFNSRQNCFNCRQIFIKNSINFVVSTAKYDSIYNSLPIPEILDEFLNSDIFADAAVAGLVSYSKCRPESIEYFIDKINRELPNVNANQIRLLIEIQSIDDKYKYERLRKLFSLIISFMKSNNQNSFNLAKPLILSLLTSPLIVQSGNRLLLYKGYNSFVYTVKNQKIQESTHQEENQQSSHQNDKKWRQLEFVNPNDFNISDDVNHFYLVECNSFSIRSTFCEFFQKAAKLSTQSFNKAFNFILEIISKIETYEEKYDQILSVLFEFLKYNPNKVHHILFSDFFDRLVNLFINEILQMKSTMLLAIPNIKCNSPLLKFAQILEFILNKPENFFFVLHRKKESIEKFIDVYHYVNSSFIAQTEDVKYSLKLLKMTTIKSMSPFLFMNSTFVENRHAKTMKEFADHLFNNTEELLRNSLGARKGISISAKGENAKIVSHDTPLKEVIEIPEGKVAEICEFIVSPEIKVGDLWLRLWVPSKGATRLEVVIAEPNEELEKIESL